MAPPSFLSRSVFGRSIKSPRSTRCFGVALLAFLSVVGLALFAPAQASAADVKQPNILVIFGDDIGITNLSTYSQGLMG